MSYYVRKINRAKWAIPEGKANVVANLRADAIANDLKTTNDTLSFWKVDSLAPDDMEPVIVVNSLMSDSFGKMELICVPDDYLKRYGFQVNQNEKDANTIISDCKHLHYDLVSLNVKNLVMFANRIVLQILQDTTLSGNERIPDALVRRYSKGELISLAKKWLQDGKFTYESLVNHKKDKILQTLQKH